MILTCPSCETRFRIDAIVLGPAGRRLKCGRCAHLWFQAPDEAPLPLPEEVAAIVEPPPPFPEPSPPDEDRVEPPRADFTPRPRRRRPSPNLPARPGRLRRRGGGLGWGLATAMLAVVLAVLVLGREQLVSFWPPAEPVYASLGFETLNTLPQPTVRPVGDGLELREIVPGRGEEGGVPYLVLDGRVVNVSEEIIEIPQLMAIVRDAQRVPLHQWVFRAEAAVLGPGESVPFSTRVAEPADTASDVKIEFTEGEGSLGADG